MSEQAFPYRGQLLLIRKQTSEVTPFILGAHETNKRELCFGAISEVHMI